MTQIQGFSPFIPGATNCGRGSSRWDSLPDPDDANELCGLSSEERDKLLGLPEHNSSCSRNQSIQLLIIAVT